MCVWKSIIIIIKSIRFVNEHRQEKSKTKKKRATKEKNQNKLSVLKKEKLIDICRSYSCAPHSLEQTNNKSQQTEKTTAYRWAIRFRHICAYYLRLIAPLRWIDLCWGVTTNNRSPGVCDSIRDRMRALTHGAADRFSRVYHCWPHYALCALRRLTFHCCSAFPNSLLLLLVFGLGCCGGGCCCAFCAHEFM